MPNGVYCLRGAVILAYVVCFKRLPDENEIAERVKVLQGKYYAKN